MALDFLPGWKACWPAEGTGISSPPQDGLAAALPTQPSSPGFSRPLAHLRESTSACRKPFPVGEACPQTALSLGDPSTDMMQDSGLSPRPSLWALYKGRLCPMGPGTSLPQVLRHCLRKALAKFSCS